jgi:hypothetical protein
MVQTGEENLQRARLSKRIILETAAALGADPDAPMQLAILDNHGNVCWWSSHGAKLVRILVGELNFFAITPQRCFELLFCLLGIPRFSQTLPNLFHSGFLCLALPSPT